jgi:hypothetical protein
MKAFFLLLVTAVAIPSFAAARYGNIVIRDGDRYYADGASDDFAEETALGKQYASFQRDGVAYVIRDAATLTRIRQIVKPQEEIGRQQAKLGAEQAALGAKQAALGVKQAALGVQQAATTSTARMNELAQQQNALSRQQQKLSDQQQPLGEQQRALGEKQREAAKKSKRELEVLFEDAIRTGVARRR